MRYCPAFLCLLPIVLAVIFYRRNFFVGESGYGFQTTADEIVAGIDLSNVTVLITGATSGLGFENARVLAAGGAHVLVGGRSSEKAGKAVTAIRHHTADGTLTPIECALGSLFAVEACARAVRDVSQHLDLLILNAGIAWVKEPTRTPDGFEKTMGVNHLAHFHLTSLLLPLVLAAEHPRVVVLSSTAASAMSSIEAMTDPSLGMNALLNGSRSWLMGVPAYGDSKLANALFAKELHNRYFDRGLLAYSVDPGEIMTGILKPSQAWFPWVLQTWGSLVEPWVLKTPAQGAATQVYCALRAPAAKSGSYCRNSNPTQLDTAVLSALMDNADATRRFWEISAKLIGEALAGDAVELE